MTTNANAPVETRHLQAADKIWGSTDGIAQSLANLEAANNRLAEIDRIAADMGWHEHSISNAVCSKRIAALASGHTPSPCPGCAAKDADLQEIDRIASRIVDDNRGEAIAAIAAKYRPPADPLAEALQNLIALARPHFTDEAQMIALEQASAALAELKSRLPLGGAK